MRMAPAWAATLVLLAACHHTPNRPEPSERAPAGAGTLSKAIFLVCAGSALEPNVFAFSAEPGRLSAVPRGDGRDVVTGVAEIRLRSTGDRSDFEGPVRVSGTASSNGSDFRLDAVVDGYRWQIDLLRNGRGRLIRSRELGGGRTETHFYSSQCQDSF